MRSSVGHEGSFGGNRERKKPGFLQRAAAGLAGLALALGGCSIGEAGAGASSSPEVTATPDTTSTAEAAPTPTADRTPKMVAPERIADNQAAVDGEFGGRRMHNVLRRSIQD